MEDYYAILGLDRGASKESIKVAFRRRAREIHPDFQANSSDKEKLLLSQQMAQVNEAYNTLHDAERRRAYDEQLRMQSVLTSKSTTAKKVTTTQTPHRIRKRPDVDSSLVTEFSNQLRARFHAKYKDSSWKDREMEGFDWALEASTWSSHCWVVLRALASVHAGSVKSFLTYADVAMTRHHGGLRKGYFLFLLAFQQMRDWDAVSLQCREFVTSESRAGYAAMLLLDVQNGRVLRFEAKTQPKLKETIDWVAANM